MAAAGSPHASHRASIQDLRPLAGRTRTVAPVVAGAVLAGLLSEPVAAETSVHDKLMDTIDRLCVRESGGLGGAVKAALKLPFSPRDGRAARSEDGSRVHAVWLGTLSGGTMVTFRGPSAKAAVRSCEIVAHSDAMAALVPQLVAAFNLGEAVPSPAAFQAWDRSGSTSLGGTRAKVTLHYGLQENLESGAFNLVISR